MSEPSHTCIVLQGVLDGRTRRTIDALLEIGKKVSVLQFAPSNASHEDQIDYEIKYLQPRSIEGSTISWRPLRIAENLGPKKLADIILRRRYGALYEDLLYSELLRIKPDVIHSINVDTLDASARAAKTLGAYLIYEAYEYWPEHSQEECVRFDRQQRTAALTAEQSYLDVADRVITVSDVLATAYKNSLGLATTPFVVYNAPTVRADSITGAHDPLKILFLGNLQAERNVMILLEAALQMPDISLTFQGDGAMRDDILAKIAQSGAENRIFVNEPVEFSEVPNSASKFDVGVIAHTAYNLQMDGALPNKFFEYMAGGLAIVAPKTSAFSTFPNIDDFAYLVDRPNTSSLRDTLCYLSENKELVEAMKASSYELSEQYVGDVQKMRIQGMYAEMMQKTPLSNMERFI